MATTATTVRLSSPAMSEMTEKSGHRRAISSKSGSARPPPSSRGVPKTKSDESLDLMQLSQASAKRNDPYASMNTSTSNRQRVANLASQMNDSASSLRSDNSKERNRRGDRKERQSSKSRPSRRQQTSGSPELEPDEDATIVSMAISGSSSKPSSGRSQRESRPNGRSSRRQSSRSRSKSRHRSKSTNARNRRRSATSRTSLADSAGVHSKTSSREHEEMDFNNSSSFIPPISPVNSERNDKVQSPPLSNGTEASKVSVSEMELLSFLNTGENGEGTPSERFTRSVPVFMMEDNTHSGRATRTVGRKGGSTRRERTTGNKPTSKDRATSIREKGDSNGGVVTSSSQYKRPPRTSRGVARSQSAQNTGSSHGPPTGVDALISPRRNLPPSGSRNRSPNRGVQRSKSTDDMGDLNNFFAHTTQISRRRKPGSASGTRSVASMPARAKARNSRRKADGNSDPMKPPSSKSTVTATETYDSDEEDESIDESMEDLNDMRDYGTSTRSVETYTSDLEDGANTSQGSMSQSFQNLSMEAALQMHMSRTENLLFDVFPKHIAEALRNGRKVEPENHECVTIFFSDIVGFTEISSELDPLKISDLLDRLYNSFDALSHYHDVFKVETIGDAYMAVTNLTKDQRDHCKRIAEFAIDAIRVANQTLIDKDDPSRGFVNIRVGFHSGPVVSNVVGSRNPRFCLFGDTVNTASRMESNSAPNRIHCSDSSAELLKEQHPNLRLNPRGTIEVKGKGDMETFWVNEDAAVQSQRNGTSRSIFKILKQRATRRGSVM